MEDFMKIIGATEVVNNTGAVEECKEAEVEEDDREEDNADDKVIEINEDEGSSNIGKVWEDMKAWLPAKQIVRVIRKCSDCGCKDVCDSDKELGICEYELHGAYRVITSAIGIGDSWVNIGNAYWRTKWAKLSQWSRVTVIDMAVSKMQIIRCDIDIDSAGVRLVEKTQFYDPKTGELTREVEKQVSNPSLASKQQLVRSLGDMSQQMLLSDKDKDTRKEKGKQVEVFGAMIAAFASAPNPSKVLK